MFKAKWSELSLTFWVTLSTLLTALPLAVSALAVHLLFSQGVAPAYDDVARRYRDHVGPVHQLEIMLWEAHSHADHYFETHEPTAVVDYAQARANIGSRFEALRGHLVGMDVERAMLARAHSHWTRSDEPAWLGLKTPEGLDAKTDDLVEVELTLALAELRSLRRSLGEDISVDHAKAIADFRRSAWISAVAGGLSVAALLGGVLLISRIMLQNVDRLVRGARKFADGDREHVIDIKVPMELREVATEFNRMIGRIRDVEDALAAEARHDPLTGLANRRSFEAAASEAFARLSRMGEPFSLVMFDIDHFKRVNDTHGHGAGDDVLRATASAIHGAIRAVDKAFRIGGEEFAVLMAGADAPGALLGAERLRRTIADRVINASGSDLSVTVSLGIAAASPAGTLDQLCREADRALYEAKTSGRNRAVVAATPPTV